VRHEEAAALMAADFAKHALGVCIGTNGPAPSYGYAKHWPQRKGTIAKGASNGFGDAGGQMLSALWRRPIRITTEIRPQSCQVAAMESIPKI